MLKTLEVQQMCIQQHISAVVTEAKEDVNNHMENLFVRERETEETKTQRKQLVGSLEYPEMHQRRNQIYSQDDGEGYYFTDEGVEYLYQFEDWSESCDDETWNTLWSWLESSDQLFWISGRPGAGKSTLMKFIVREQRTLDTLCKWEPEAEILSHYFWKIGTDMQNTWRGLMCSLLYQALVENEQLCEEMIMKFPKVRKMKFHYDWAEETLREAVIFILKSSSVPYCIFIDALDEMSRDEDVVDLLEFVQSLCQISKTKFCMSSRPEWILSQELAAVPSLALHDITKRAMYFYIKRELEKHLADSPQPDEDGRFYEELIVKAEGVFLWLALVVQNIKRALRNGDSQDEILARTMQLPSKLEDLYKDMWERLGDDGATYRKTAANYINLVLDCTEIVDLMKGDYYRRLRTNSALSIVLASQPQFNHQVCFCASEEDFDNLEKWYKKELNKIRARCVGFLEVNAAVETSAFVSHTESIDFVHRTARDFFVEAEQGKEILSYDSSNCSDRLRSLANAFICTAAFYGGDEYPAVFHSLSLVALSKSLELCKTNEAMLLAKDTILFLDDVLSMRGCLGSLAAFMLQLPGLTCLFDSGQFYLPRGTATIALRQFWMTKRLYHIVSGPLQWKVTKQLISMGADVATKGFNEKHNVLNHTVLHEHVTFESPFGAFLLCLYDMLYRKGFFYMNISGFLDELLMVLQLCLQQLPDLTEVAYFSVVSNFQFASQRKLVISDFGFIPRCLENDLSGLPINGWVVETNMRWLCHQVVFAYEHKDLSINGRTILKDIRKMLECADVKENIPKADGSRIIAFIWDQPGWFNMWVPEVSDQAFLDLGDTSPSEWASEHQSVLAILDSRRYNPGGVTFGHFFTEKLRKTFLECLRHKPHTFKKGRKDTLKYHLQDLLKSMLPENALLELENEEKSNARDNTINPENKGKGFLSPRAKELLYASKQRDKTRLLRYGDA